MLDHCCEGMLYLKPQASQIRKKLWGWSLQGHDPYVSHTWQTGLKTTSQEGERKAAGFLLCHNFWKVWIQKFRSVRTDFLFNSVRAIKKLYFTLSRMQVRFLLYYSSKGRVVWNTTTDNIVFSRNLFF